MELKTQNKTIPFYEKLGIDLDINRYRLDTSWKVEVTSKVIPKAKFNIVLEVGCGAGLVLKGISQLVESERTIGIDISNSMLVIAQKECPEGLFIRGEVEHLPFKDQSVDLVILSDILEHVIHPYNLIAEARRVSKNIVFKIPLERCLARELLKIFRNEKYCGFEHHKSGHLWAWNKEEALSLLSNAGVMPKVHKLAEPPDEIRYYDAPVKFWSWVEKSLYKYARPIYRILFGSTLVAFSQVKAIQR